MFSGPGGNTKIDQSKINKILVLVDDFCIEELNILINQLIIEKSKKEPKNNNEDTIYA